MTDREKEVIRKIMYMKNTMLKYLYYGINIMITILFVLYVVMKILHFERTIKEPLFVIELFYIFIMTLNLMELWSSIRERYLSFVLRICRNREEFVNSYNNVQHKIKDRKPLHRQLFLQELLFEYGYQSDLPEKYLSFMDAQYSDPIKRDYLYWSVRAKVAFLTEDMAAARESLSMYYMEKEHCIEDMSKKDMDRFEYPLQVIDYILNVSSGKNEGTPPPTISVIRKERNNPELYLWEGFCCAATGEMEKAQKRWKRLVTIGGNYTDAKIARRMIGNEHSIKTYNTEVRECILYLIIFLTEFAALIWWTAIMAKSL